MANLKYFDVFVPGGFPRHTYNPRESLSLENRLSEVLENLCKLVTITGHTKSGKTVLTRKVLPTESSVWVDGGSVADEEDFWSIIIERLSAFQETSEESEEGVARKFEVKAKASASVLVAKGEGELGKVRTSP